MTKLSGKTLEIAERRLACENGRFTVYMDHLHTSLDYEVKDYLVVVPKIISEGLTSGVAVLPCRDKKIGLIHLYRHPVSEQVWELPRGFVDMGESPTASALRELEEETGLSCSEASLLDLGTIMPEAGVLQAQIRLFAALECEKVQEFPCDEIGHLEFRWFNAEEIWTLIQNNVIKDATTITALCKLFIQQPSVLQSPIIGQKKNG